MTSWTMKEHGSGRLKVAVMYLSSVTSVFASQFSTPNLLMRTS